MPELLPYKDGIYLWDYVPSKPASIAFLAVFGALTGYTIQRMITTKSWFSLAFIIGGLMEMGGFAVRSRCTDHTDDLALFAVQEILILIAPSLFAASVYMTLGRLIRCLKAESLSIISPRWLTRLFVAGDILSFVVQFAGAAMVTNPDSNPKIAKWSVLLGLFLQIVFFGLFIVTACIFHMRVRKWLPASSSYSSLNWFAIMVMLYIVSGLVLFRSIFRVVEFGIDDDYLLKHEWPLYVFDAALMVAAMAAYGIQYPGALVTTATYTKGDDEVPMYEQHEYGRLNEPQGSTTYDPYSTHGPSRGSFPRYGN